MISNGFENCDLLTKTEAAVREGISERQIENRIKSGYYRTVGEKRDLRIVFPKATKPDAEISEPPSKPSEGSFEIVRTAYEMVIEEKDKTITLLKEEVETLKGELEFKNKQIDQYAELSRGMASLTAGLTLSKEEPITYIPASKPQGVFTKIRNIFSK